MPLFQYYVINTGIGIPMVVNYNSYTSKESRAISRCDYDAVPLLASLPGATQRKSHLAINQAAQCFSGLISLIILCCYILKYRPFSSKINCIKEMTTPIDYLLQLTGSSLKYWRTLTGFFFTQIYLTVCKRKLLTCLSITVVILKQQQQSQRYARISLIFFIVSFGRVNYTRAEALFLHLKGENAKSPSST